MLTSKKAMIVLTALAASFCISAAVATTADAPANVRSARGDQALAAVEKGANEIQFRRADRAFEHQPYIARTQDTWQYHLDSAGSDTFDDEIVLASKWNRNLGDWQGACVKVVAQTWGKCIKPCFFVVDWCADSSGRVRVAKQRTDMRVLRLCLYV